MPLILLDIVVGPTTTSPQKNLKKVLTFGVGYDIIGVPR